MSFVQLLKRDEDFMRVVLILSMREANGLPSLTAAELAAHIGTGITFEKVLTTICNNPAYIEAKNIGEEFGVYCDVKLSLFTKTELVRMALKPFMPKIKKS